MWEIRFADSANKKFVEYRNYRGFNFTRSRNKMGVANFNLDLSPTSKTIRAGWLVNIFKDGSLKYWGMVNKRTKAANKLSIGCIDAIGILNRRKYDRRQGDTAVEASVEIQSVFDGLAIVGGYTLSADDFLSVTGTSEKWHWEKNAMADYIGDIGEKVNNLSGNPATFFFWISPQLSLYMSEDGQNGIYGDLPLSNITSTEDITDTFNNVTVEGQKFIEIPYDRDAWTENVDLNSWDHSFGDTITYDQVNPQSGNVSLRTDATAGIVALLRKALRDKNNNFLNLENLHTLHVHQKYSAATVTYIRVDLEDTNGDVSGWNLTQGGTGNWSEDTIDIDYGSSPDFTSGGGADLTQIEFIWFVMEGTTLAYLNIDGLYLVLDAFTGNASDVDSINKYGSLDKYYIDRTLYSNADCVALATILLDHGKDAKEQWNINADSFIDIIPNSTLKFEDEGNTIIKPISSVTYYVNIDGSESTQITVGDFKKTNIDKLMEKLQEIGKHEDIDEIRFKVI